MTQNRIVFLTASILVVMTSLSAYSQDTTVAHYNHLQEQYASNVNKKVSSFNEQVDSYTQKTLKNVIGQEKKMQNKVAKIDSVKARVLFKYSIDSLKKFETKIKSKVSRVTKLLGGRYFPYLDTLKQSLSFMNKAQASLDNAAADQNKLKASLSSVDAMEAKMATVDQINEYLKQRQAVLATQLTSFPGLSGNIQNINKQAAYYQAQISSYKSTLADPEKIEKLVLSMLENTPAFQKFFQQNSQLSGVFASPPSLSSIAGGIGTTPVVNGIPSRATLQQFVQEQSPSTNFDPVQAVQQKVQSMQGTGSGAGSGSGVGGIEAITGKLHGSGQTGSASMPNLVPNSQATKSFGKRLEYGVNVQFGSSTNYLPATSQFSAQVGYKLNDKTSAGIGVSYSMGIGTGWNHIRISNDAVGFQSYVRWKPKKAFFLQGGGEWNYLTAFSGIAQLRNFNAWQTSALAGIGKDYQVTKKVRGSVLLLYDFLYSTHVPVSQPFSFRIGYNF